MAISERIDKNDFYVRVCLIGYGIQRFLQRASIHAARNNAHQTHWGVVQNIPYR
jgi:hypothetical protein